jgi:hypothetical protein
MDFSLGQWRISIAEKLSICPAGKSLVFGFDAPLLVALTRSDLQALGLGALVFDLEITRHRLSADVEGMALAGLPIGQYS